MESNKGNSQGAIAGITDAQWLEMARLMALPLEDVKSRYEQFLIDMANHPERLNQKGKVIVHERAPAGDAPAQLRGSIPISFCPISNVLCMNFSLDWSGGSEWSLGVSASVTVLGKPVWSSNLLRLSPSQKYIHLEPSLALFKMDIYLGVRQTPSCANSFYIQGKACYYLPFSWHCSDSFDENLYCL